MTKEQKKSIIDEIKIILQASNYMELSEQAELIFDKIIEREVANERSVWEMLLFFDPDEKNYSH